MNTVGATDAAGAAIPVAGGPTSRVTDSALYEMATVEFAAPKGIQPWEGNVILNEHLGSDLQSTWVSSLIGAGVISIEKNGQAVDIELLVSREELSEFDRRLIDILMPGGATSRRVYKKYTESFATTWKEIREALTKDIKEKNWWNKPLRAWNKRTSIIGAWVSAASLVGVILILDSIEIRDPDGNVADFAPNALTDSAVGVVVAVAIAGFLLGAISTKGRIASRTAAGSALYLQTESFRRFLAQSEGRHVEEAHRLGVLREYSAWAVVLGEATAWKKAADSLDDLAIAGEVDLTQSSLTYITILTAASVPPSSSDSSGGGGGGGGSGGGGGGGGSGGW
jgi:uncharacterized membrane protein